MRRMYDGTDASGLPADGQLYAGYIDGAWPSYAAIVARFPHAVHVSITTGSNLGAQVNDCERGDDTPAQAAAWAAEKHAHGQHPTIYCSASDWQQLRDLCAAAGLDPARDVSWWVAQWDNVQTVPAGAVAKQYASNPGYDANVVADYWPGVDPAPSQPNGDHVFVLYADGRTPVLFTCTGARAMSRAQLDGAAAAKIPGHSVTPQQYDELVSVFH